MSTDSLVATDIPPPVSTDIRVSAPDKDGISVVKNQRKHKYIRVGTEEAFLLSVLDGNHTVGEIAERFEQEFGEPISEDDVLQFVTLAKKQGLLKRRGRSKEAPPPPRTLRGFLNHCIAAAKKQSPLFFRVKLYDPNENLNWLEPKTRFLFSTALAVFAAVTGAIALGVVWVERTQLAEQIVANFGWKMFLVAWCTTIVITIFHEFGHGLACKRYGGDVHEMGILWIFFTPCFYCNVSDAWLVPSRWKRLLISMAGTYIDFLVFIVAVFVWRVTSLDSAMNFAAWVIVSTCGLRVAFNLNPLMRLDGYYALCDLLHTHNLRKRARAHFLGHVRWLFWGAEKPVKVEEHRTLLAYGTCNWVFTVGFLGLMSFQASKYLQSMMGIGGIIAAFGVFSLLTRRYFQGSLGEDFKSMFQARKIRVIVWLTLIAAFLAIPIHDRAGGEFHVRPVVRREVRAPIAGFLREIKVDQGDTVSAEKVVAVIEVPELTSNIARKKAEIAESEARLRRLKCGPREEEVVDQQEKIKRASQWRDLAKGDLEKARKSFEQEIESLDLTIDKANENVNYQEAILAKMQTLHDRGGLAGQQLLNYKKKYQEALLDCDQAKADKKARQAEGVILFERELARRAKELADAEAALVLLQAGSRVEDIDAEAARLRRLEEELNHFQHQAKKQTVAAPVSGTIITPRFREMVGLFVDRGMPLCVIEDLRTMEAEISVSEKDARVLATGHPITLKPRSLPLETLTAKVDRVAPAAQAGEPGISRAVTVYCTVDNSAGVLRTGMTGYARIHTQRQPLGVLIFNAGVRLLRTEFSW